MNKINENYKKYKQAIDHYLNCQKLYQLHQDFGTYYDLVMADEQMHKQENELCSSYKNMPCNIKSLIMDLKNLEKQSVTPFEHDAQFDEVVELRNKRYQDATRLIKQIYKAKRSKELSIAYANIIINYVDELCGIELSVKSGASFPQQTYKSLPDFRHFSVKEIKQLQSEFETVDLER